MTAYYLPKDTRYVTNQGLKYAYEFNENTQLLVLDRLNKLSYTFDFNLVSGNFNTLNTNTDHNFKGLISTIPVEYDDFTTCPFLNDTPSQVRCRIDGEDLKMLIGKDLAVVMTLFVSSYFKEVDGSVLSNPVYNRFIYSVFSTINNFTSIYFPWNKSSHSYVMNNSSFFKAVDDLETRLLENINIFESIVKTAKDVKYAHYKGYYYIDFRTYRIAVLYSALLSLIGYKSRVKFIKDNTVFRVSYTNHQRCLQHEYTCDNIKTTYFEPVLCYSIQLADRSLRYIAVQNIDNITMSSIS